MRILVFLFLLSTFSLSAQFRCQDLKMANLNGASQLVNSINNNAKSDTIDILHYDLDLNLYSIASQQLKGICSIRFTPKMNNVNTMGLDLLKLQVDSIQIGGANLSYSYNDTIIRVNLGSNYSSNDTINLKVYYQGSPQGDASGWGGFHYQSGYYYNLGVGFAADPHTYGRAWFPCFDNFVEKSAYSFTTLTKSPNKAYCNGIRTNTNLVGTDSIYSNWSLTDPIPTYLASVAVSTYKELNSSVNANLGPLPIQLMTKATDTANLASSFRNLNNTILGLENSFGPYRWQKVGYAVTTVGAMEHATSIHYPISLVDGTLNGEDIMAHELAHHWWGNLITCETAADMWINEGMAEYSSHLYLEKIYNRNRYLDEVRNNAFQVLNRAHRQDGGYRAIYDLPHEYVYGFHVYQKGAMVGHNLRAYLGDNLFFSGLTTLLSNNAFSNLSTTEFRDQLSSITGKPLNAFFDGWVLNPGFPSFSVDSMDVSTSNNTTFIKVVQHVREAPTLFSNVPVEITFFSSTGDTTSRPLIIASNSGSATFTNLPFAPAFALVNYSAKLLSGDTYDNQKLNTKKIYTSQYSKLRLTVNSVTDSTEMIVMHHWAGPNNRISTGKDYRISTHRFWSVKGYNFQNSDVTARINYDGTVNGFDNDLLNITEDSLKVLYRANPWDKWELYADQIKTDLGSSTNGLGYIELEHLKPGDYVLANTAEVIGVEELKLEKGSIEIYPNPTQGQLNFRFKNYDSDVCSIIITNMQGKFIHNSTHNIENNHLSINLPDLASGSIMVNIDGISKQISLFK